MSFQSVSGFHPLDLISPAFDAMGTYAQSFNGVPVQYAVGSEPWKHQVGLSSKYGTKAAPAAPGAGGGAPPSSAYSWQFPQYSQSWAFTPPATTPFGPPPAFDKAKYGANPLASMAGGKAGGATGGTASGTPMSIADLMAKYSAMTGRSTPALAPFAGTQQSPTNFMAQFSQQQPTQTATSQYSPTSIFSQFGQRQPAPAPQPSYSINDLMARFR